MNKEKKKKLQWTLHTNEETFTSVDAQLLQAQLERLHTKQLEYLILEPSRPVTGVAYIQTAAQDNPDGSRIYCLEIAKETVEKETILFHTDPAPFDQVQRGILDFFRIYYVPDTSGWIVINTYPHALLFDEGCPQWPFSDTVYSDTVRFVEAVNGYAPENRENWHPEDVTLASRYFTLDYTVCEQQAPSCKANESVVKVEPIPGSSYACYYLEAKIEAENHESFTNGELLRAIHNQLTHRKTGIWKDTFTLERVSADYMGPVFAFYRGGFGRKGMGMASNGDHSIYRKIHQLLLEKGQLPPGFTVQTEKQSQYVDGALEGICRYHFHPTVPDLEPMEKAILSASKGNGVEAEKSLEAIFQDENSPMYAFAGPILDWLYHCQGNLDLENVLAFSWNLLERSGQKECIKFGLTLLSTLQYPQTEELHAIIRELGHAEEFAFFALLNMLSWENGNGEIFRLAQALHGWGKIHAVHFLQPTSEAIRQWLLHEGIENEILPEYSAEEVAEKIDLLAVVEQCEPGSQDFLDAGNILLHMIIGGPTFDMDDYRPRKKLLKAYLKKAAEVPSRQEIEEVLSAISDYAKRKHWPKLMEKAEIRE